MSEPEPVSSISPLPDRDPVRLLTWGYVLALAIIGLMSVSIHVMIDRIVAEQDSVASVISRSMNQITLAQSVALSATTYVHQPEAATREELTKTAKQMRDMHMALVKESMAQRDTPSAAPDILVRIYFEQPYELNTKVLGFLEHVDKLAAKDAIVVDPTDADYKEIMQQVRGSLGASLNSSLYTYETTIVEKINKLQAFQRMAIFVIIATLVGEAFFIFMPLVGRVRRYADELKKITMTDLLTGIGNRRYFVFRGSQEIQRARRLRKELCLALIDLDRFKTINDNYGHKSGDMVLQQFVHVIQKCMRHEDVFARLGGEEFAVLLPHTSSDDGQRIVERMRMAVEATEFQLDRGLHSRITMSAGLTRVNLTHDDFEAAIVLADVAMYDAKRSGRNRVVFKEAESFFDGQDPADNVVPIKPA